MHDEDRKSFKRALEGVRVLHQDKVLPHVNRPLPVPKQTRRDEKQVVADLLSEDFAAAEVDSGDERIHFRPGLQKTVLRKLRRGEYTISAELDLHGCTVPQARTALIKFLSSVRHSRHVCVRVVHGKGRGSPGRKPILKNKVFHWLCQRDEVLAICPARPFDGGSGAVYVLLKKR